MLSIGAILGHPRTGTKAQGLWERSQFRKTPGTLFIFSGGCYSVLTLTIEFGEADFGPAPPSRCLCFALVGNSLVQEH